MTTASVTILAKMLFTWNFANILLTVSRGNFSKIWYSGEINPIWEQLIVKGFQMSKNKKMDLETVVRTRAGRRASILTRDLLPG